MTVLRDCWNKVIQFIHLMKNLRHPTEYNGEKSTTNPSGDRTRAEKRTPLPHPDLSAFGHEWTVLQDHHEQYEKTCLLVKLSGIALFVACLALSMDPVITLLLVLVIWIQEAILRTGQSRLGQRILHIEQLIAEDASAPASVPYQLHSTWLATRPGLAGLLAEYGRNMLRPTVAFPYVVLIGITVAWLVFA